PRTARRAAGAPAGPGEYADAQWAWVRKRVIECYKQAGTPGEAVTLFRQALKKEPRDLDTRLQLAEALLANDQEQAAINELHRILEVDPNHVEAKLRLVAIYSVRGEWSYALRFAREAQQSEPDREDTRRILTGVLLHYGTQLQTYGSHIAALAILEEGRQVAPTDWHFPLYMARIHLDQRQAARARPLLTQAEQLAGDDRGAYIFLLEAWAVLGDVAEFHAVLARVEAALPLTPDFYIEAGGAVLAHQRRVSGTSRKARAQEEALTTLAIELVDRSLTSDPDNLQTRLQIARTLMLSRPDLALRYAEEAVQRAPESPEALIVLGTVQGLNDQTAAAKQTVRNAARLARKHGDSAHAREADELARRLASPYFRLSFEMQQVAQLFDLPDEILDELDMEGDIFG
ncbi:MAG TPA: tetratricopeptide repeat protein, partial [Chloroflexota bacterium]|nr:tetratricopeptide repeat protein [Chloroflexota bacterium]